MIPLIKFQFTIERYGIPHSERNYNIADYHILIGFAEFLVFYGISVLNMILRYTSFRMVLPLRMVLPVFIFNTVNPSNNYITVATFKIFYLGMSIQ